MSWFTDFFWPTLERVQPAELAAEAASESADIAAARAGLWAQNPELALEEARRLADTEEDRRRSTEGKASTYLLFAGAFAAALIPFLPAILEGKTGSAPPWLIAIILICATLYLVFAAIWAFRTLHVEAYHQLDVAGLTQIWGQANPRLSLIREIFTLTRRNYHAVNEKVSYIKMAHEFMVRSFVAFGILLIVEAGWQAAYSVTTPFVCTAPRVLASTKANPASLGAKPWPGVTMSSVTKPDVGATNSRAKGPSNAAGSTSSVGGAPGK